MSELTGQLELGNFLPEQTAETAEGWDVNGNLMDYAPGVPEEAPAQIDEAGAARLHEITDEINTLKAHIRGAVLAAAMGIGLRLIEAKALVPRGRWGEWLRLNVEFSERKAQDMMRLYEEYGRGVLPEAVARMDYTKAVALLALPEEQREAVAERAAEEGMSVRKLQDEIAALKAEDARRQQRIDALTEQAQAAEKAIRSERDAAERARAEAKAAGETAEALKKERDEAQKTSRLEIDKARDAVQRANDLQKRLTEAGEKLAEMESRPVETVEVERAPRAEAEVKLRVGYERLLSDFKEVESLLGQVKDGDPQTGAKYAAAIARACAAMAGRFGGSGEEIT